MIYLDNAASTKDLSVPYVYMPWKPCAWDYNSHSIHEGGLLAIAQLRKVEGIIKDNINGHNGKFLWTGSGSQANSLAIRIMSALDKVITSKIEHKSILQYDESWGIDTYNLIEPDTSGHIVSDTIREIFDREHGNLSIQLVNNETGAIHPIKQIAKLDRGFDSLIHVDAAQAFGKMPIDVEDLDIDLMTISAHKAHGPKGLGGLWIRNKAVNYDKKWGPHEEYLGTVPVELVDRLAHVIEKTDIKENMEITEQLENRLIDHLNEHKVNYQQISPKTERLPGILSLRFPGIRSDDMVAELSKKQIYISAGSACNNLDVEPSHVLLAMGMKEEEAMETIRISTDFLNSFEEMETTAAAIADITKER